MTWYDAEREVQWRKEATRAVADQYDVTQDRRRLDVPRGFFSRLFDRLFSWRGTALTQPPTIKQAPG